MKVAILTELTPQLRKSIKETAKVLLTYGDGRAEILAADLLQLVKNAFVVDADKLVELVKETAQTMQMKGEEDAKGIGGEVKAESTTTRVPSRV